MSPGSAARWIAMPLGAAAISTSGILIRLTQSSPLVTASNRLLWAGAILLLWAVCTERRALAALRPRDVALLATSGVLLGLHFALWTSSLFQTSVASAVFLTDTHPIMVALIALLFLGERTAVRVWLGIGATLLGSAIIGYGDFRLGASTLLGDLTAGGASITFAGYLVIGRHARQLISVAAYAGLVYSIGGIVIVLLELANRTDIGAFSSRDALLWLGLVLAPTLGGHTVFNWALRYVPVSVVGVAILGEPVGTTVLAWVVLGEPPGALDVLGGAVILVGVLLALTSPSVPSLPSAGVPIADVR